MLKKAYLEITNVCNLSCSFCHGTKREKRFITEEQFTLAASRIRPFCRYLYLHLMGEPLLHPLLPRFLDIAGEMGFKVIITTNGTLLDEKGDVLLNAPSLHKVSVSLHAFEANTLSCSLEEYLDSCFRFCSAASDGGIISVLRLWNLGGEDALNGAVLCRMREHFGADWVEQRGGFKIKDRLYLEWGDKFDWPDIDLAPLGNKHACYGLRDQIGIHCDGTVVPCCLDAEGDIALGNIFQTPLDEILASPRAVALKRSFENRCVKEPLCQRCGFANDRM